MSDKRTPRRSLDDWMELVTECRQSGLTDAAWCEAQGISPSCFYNAVSRLHKRACQIPDPIGRASTLDLTSHKQDVVQIAIEPETSPAELFQDERSSSMYLDNSHTIEIEAKGLTIRMSNTVQPMLLKILMDALKEPLCCKRKSGEFLQLFWVIKATKITHFCNKHRYCFKTYSFDFQKLINIGNLT